VANDIGASINTHLLAQTGVTAICAQRGYPDVLPKDCLLPAFTYEVISEQPSHHMGGVSGLRESRIQIDSYADTRKQANELDEAILAAIDMQRGTLGGTFCNTIQAQERLSGTDAAVDGSDRWRYVTIRDYLVFYIP
jgi:hypothetical protein